MYEVTILTVLFSFPTVMYQKRLKKERKQRQHVQDQLELELKRRQKIEEALKQSGAPSEILRIVTGKNFNVNFLR